MKEQLFHLRHEMKRNRKILYIVLGVVALLTCGTGLIVYFSAKNKHNKLEKEEKLEKEFDAEYITLQQ